MSVPYYIGAKAIAERLGYRSTRMVMKLVERADVLVWNTRPAAMARLKLAYDDVRAVNPHIIYCGMFGCRSAAPRNAGVLVGAATAGAGMDPPQWLRWSRGVDRARLGRY